MMFPGKLENLPLPRWQGWKLFLLLESPFYYKPALTQDLAPLFPPNRVKRLTVHWVSIDFFLSEAWELSASIIFDFPMKYISLPLTADKQQLEVVLSAHNVFVKTALH